MQQENHLCLHHSSLKRTKIFSEEDIQHLEKIGEGLNLRLVNEIQHCCSLAFKQESKFSQQHPSNQDETSKQKLQRTEMEKILI